MKITKETFETAKAYMEAKHQLEIHLVPDLIARAGQVPSMRRFWELNTFLASTIRTRISNAQSAEPGIHEFVRIAVVGYGFPQGMKPYNLVDVMQFANTYRAVVVKVQNKLGPFFDYHGDSFNDLCDSLPLMGPQIFNKPWQVRCESDWDNICKKFEPHNKDIFHGENYIRSTLEDKILFFFVHGLNKLEELGLEVENV